MPKLSVMKKSGLFSVEFVEPKSELKKFFKTNKDLKDKQICAVSQAEDVFTRMVASAFASKVEVVILCPPDYYPPYSFDLNIVGEKMSKQILTQISNHLPKMQKEIKDKRAELSVKEVDYNVKKDKMSKKEVKQISQEIQALQNEIESLDTNLVNLKGNANGIAKEFGIHDYKFDVVKEWTEGVEGLKRAVGLVDKNESAGEDAHDQERVDLHEEEYPANEDEDPYAQDVHEDEFIVDDMDADEIIHGDETDENIHEISYDSPYENVDVDPVVKTVHDDVNEVNKDTMSEGDFLSTYLDVTQTFGINRLVDKINATDQKVVHIDEHLLERLNLAEIEGFVANRMKSYARTHFLSSASVELEKIRMKAYDEYIRLTGGAHNQLKVKHDELKNTNESAKQNRMSLVTKSIDDIHDIEYSTKAEELNKAHALKLKELENQINEKRDEELEKQLAIIEDEFSESFNDPQMQELIGYKQKIEYAIENRVSKMIDQINTEEKQLFETFSGELADKGKEFKSEYDIHKSELKAEKEHAWKKEQVDKEYELKKRELEIKKQVASEHAQLKQEIAELKMQIASNNGNQLESILPTLIQLMNQNTGQNRSAGIGDKLIILFMMLMMGGMFALVFLR